MRAWLPPQVRRESDTWKRRDKILQEHFDKSQKDHVKTTEPHTTPKSRAFVPPCTTHATELWALQKYHHDLDRNATGMIIMEGKDNKQLFNKLMAELMRYLGAKLPCVTVKTGCSRKELMRENASSRVSLSAVSARVKAQIPVLFLDVRERPPLLQNDKKYEAWKKSQEQAAGAQTNETQDARGDARPASRSRGKSIGWSEAVEVMASTAKAGVTYVGHVVGQAVAGEEDATTAEYNPVVKDGEERDGPNLHRRYKTRAELIKKAKEHIQAWCKELLACKLAETFDCCTLAFLRSALFAGSRRAAQQSACSLHEAITAAQEQGKTKSGALGSKWTNVGAVAPTSGRKLTNAKLSFALKRRTDFKAEDLATFELTQLQATDYIKSGGSYFQPAAPKFLEHAKDSEVQEAVGWLTNRIFSDAYDVTTKQEAQEAKRKEEAQRPQSTTSDEAAGSGPSRATEHPEKSRPESRSDYLDSRRDYMNAYSTYARTLLQSQPEPRTLLQSQLRSVLSAPLKPLHRACAASRLHLGCIYRAPQVGALSRR